ncbi:uncharacterized protein [Dermacentor albipictus]|uniref:uncharacterized protein n=1 Tax=Dermacentor albipictus TaxID=60249 RepID=UPI0038FC6590
MFSASKDLSAPGRGAAQASGSSNDYRVVLPRLPTGKLVVDSVFLHADLSGRPYRAQDFRDALRTVIDLKEISSIGQFQMSHVWMVTCKSGMTKSKLVACGELSVKGRRCVVIDPEPTEVKMKLLWLPEHLEDDYIRDALQAYGKVKSISAESWRVSEMEQMRTLNRDVVLTLADGVSVGDVPHLLPVCGVQSLVLIPGRHPLCLRCNKVGHIRRNCRTPRCETCRRFGHTAEECVVTYADKLRHRTKPPDESLQEHIMDITEVLDATGDVPSSAETRCANKAPLPVEDSHNAIARECQLPTANCQEYQLPVNKESSEEKDDQPKQQPKGAPATTEPAAAQQANEGAGDDSSDAPKQLDTCTEPAEDSRSNADTSVPKRRATNRSESSTDSETTSTTRKARRRKTSKHSGKCRRSRSRRPAIQCSCHHHGVTLGQRQSSLMISTKTRPQKSANFLTTSDFNSAFSCLQPLELILQDD